MDGWKNGITGTVDDCDDGHGVDDTMIAKTNRWCEISCIQVYIKFMRMKKKANKNQNIKNKTRWSRRVRYVANNITHRTPNTEFISYNI